MRGEYTIQRGALVTMVNLVKVTIQEWGMEHPVSVVDNRLVVDEQRRNGEEKVCQAVLVRPRV
ncbi:hypothetical protein DPMN_188346 [Dreissena polymorpha]|uniref:Uncharacterized protein n=1 Tax=Dreissena polymorpha TaxID=45954 RepID=A0A9D4DR47_DREPO|nr:hypothetical protein DPMN_188346 [Dreissena polymorpha]